MVEFKTTPYGFRYGSAEVTRICSDDKAGWVVFEVKTKKEKLEINCLKGGKIHIARYKKEKGKWKELFQD